MPITFEPLKLPDASIFGVRVGGSVGRRDRQRLLELADRCLENQKNRLVVDLTVLATLGGAGAGIFADLQRRLREQGGELVFVGASDVVRHFLEQRFRGLSLQCVPTLSDAVCQIGGNPAGEASAGEAPAAEAPAASPTGGEGGLDHLLEAIDSPAPDATDARRRTADLITAPYLPLAEALAALRTVENPTAFGEALGSLLHSQDLAGDTIYLGRDGRDFVAVKGGSRLPVDGSVAAALAAAARPLTLLDLEDGALSDQEAVALEALEPDLLLPVRWGGELHGVAVLRRGKDDPEYGLAETFALELLLRALTAERDAAAGFAPASSARPADSGPLASPADAGPVAPPPAADAAPDGDRTPPPAEPSDGELLSVRLAMARDLSRAQDETHFWQILHARLQEVARVRSLLCLDGERSRREPYFAGTARSRKLRARLDGERICAFFRSLERPVEIRNMPNSFASIRDALLDLDLDWVVGLNVDGRSLGAAMIGLQWRTPPPEEQRQLHALMEVAAEQLASLRDGQRRAEFELRIVETLVARAAALAGDDPAHARLLTRHVRLLATSLGLPPDQERELVLGTLLRNLGDASPGSPPDERVQRREGAAWEEYRRHPDRGADQLEDLRASAALCDAVRHHHERYDGTGFPHGLAARSIPLSARIVAVVQDYVTALDEARGDADRALATIAAAAGEVLDPDLVERFAAAVRQRDEQCRREAVPA